MEDRHNLSEPRPVIDPSADGTLPTWEVDIFRDGVDTPIMTLLINKDVLPPRKRKKKIVWKLPDSVDSGTPKFGTEDKKRILEIFKQQKKERRRRKSSVTLNSSSGSDGDGGGDGGVDDLDGSNNTDWQEERENNGATVDGRNKILSNKKNDGKAANVTTPVSADKKKKKDKKQRILNRDKLVLSSPNPAEDDRDFKALRDFNKEEKEPASTEPTTPEHSSAGNSPEQTATIAPPGFDLSNLTLDDISDRNISTSSNHYVESQSAFNGDTTTQPPQPPPLQTSRVPETVGPPMPPPVSPLQASPLDGGTRVIDPPQTTYSPEPLLAPLSSNKDFPPLTRAVSAPVSTTQQPNNDQSQRFRKHNHYHHPQQQHLHSPVGVPNPLPGTQLLHPPPGSSGSHTLGHSNAAPFHHQPHNSDLLPQASANPGDPTPPASPPGIDSSAVERTSPVPPPVLPRYFAIPPDSNASLVQVVAETYYMLLMNGRIDELSRYYTPTAQKAVTVGGAHAVCNSQKEMYIQLQSLAGMVVHIKGLLAQPTIGNASLLYLTGTCIQPHALPVCHSLLLVPMGNGGFQIQNDSLCFLTAE